MGVHLEKLTRIPHNRIAPTQDEEILKSSNLTDMEKAVRLHRFNPVKYKVKNILEMFNIHKGDFRELLKKTKREDEFVTIKTGVSFNPILDVNTY